MPSPSIISRSSSFPHLNKTWPSQYTLPENLPPANRSARSAPTSSAKLTWGLKIRKLIGRSGSDLTEITLEVHNKTHVGGNVINLHKGVEPISLEGYYKGEVDDERSSKYSPYYIRGLTYPSFVDPKPPISSTPGRESQRSTSTRTSISTFFSGFQVREWSSCLGSRSKDYSNKLRPDMYTPIKPSTPSTVNASSTNSETSLVKKENIERKEVMRSSNEYNKKEPLREGVREAAAPAPRNDQIKLMREAEKEHVWADKYQPLCLEDFICNRNKATQLQELARGGGCGHFIFEGPPGVGKRTMIWAMLREAFGRDTIHAREEFKAFNLKGEMVGSIEVQVKQSPQHVEVNLSELKGYEKHVIVELIRETQDQTPDKSLPCSLDNCRAIILYEADKLSTDALLYIKWLLERYKGCNKVFFCCSDISKLQAIKSLCTIVELLPPSKSEIVEVLKFIAKQEGIDLPHELAERFAENSKNTLRLAIRSFEATWKKCYPFKEDQVILTGWDDNIADIAKNMIQEQSPKQLYIIRGKLQNLIVHGVSPGFIFKTLVAELKMHLDDSLQGRIESMYDEYNRNDENMFRSDKAMALSRRDHEYMGKRLNDQSRKHIQQFLRIEDSQSRKRRSPVTLHRHRVYSQVHELLQGLQKYQDFAPWWSDVRRLLSRRPNNSEQLRKELCTLGEPFSC